jgi:hypothetical protein
MNTIKKNLFSVITVAFVLSLIMLSVSPKDGHSELLRTSSLIVSAIASTVEPPALSGR